jgi:putative hydrolase of the HAD superfamily
VSDNAAAADGIRGLILDYGEVLCCQPAGAHLARMAEAVGLEMSTFAARYQCHRSLYDRGDLSPLEYWMSVKADTIELNDGLLKRLRLWDVEMWSNTNPAMINWLSQLSAAGFKTAVLSNMHSDMASHARRSFEWLCRLDCSTLSCEVRMVKPERAIYERCVRDLAIRPSDILFIDDRRINVQAAKDAGLAAVQFESVERLQDDLAKIHFPILPVVQSACDLA